MNYKLKSRAVLALSFMLILIFVLIGCKAVNDVDKTEGTSPDVTQEPQTFPEDVTLYEKYGLAIAIPNEIIDQLIIITEPQREIFKDTYLLSVYEKRSYETARHDYPDSYAGYIFSITRYTQAQYEQFLSSDGSGQSFFAKDDTYYYGWFIPTDLQFYIKGDLDMQSDEWKAWVELNEKCNAVKDDFITRNNLKAYSDSEFWNRDFTYDSEHIFICYYPYYAQNGSKDEVWMLILSQPVTQGDTGILCVERWKDQYGNIYPYFPVENGIPSSEYYAALQAECAAGKNMTWLDPEQAALAFVKNVFEHTSATLDSFVRSDSPIVPSNQPGSLPGDTQN